MHSIGRTISKSLVYAIITSLFSTLALAAETLNPEGINPHVQAPRKRISLEQKKAAAEARKKKKAEIAARRAAGNRADKKHGSAR